LQREKMRGLDHVLCVASEYVDAATRCVPMLPRVRLLMMVASFTACVRAEDGAR